MFGENDPIIQPAARNTSEEPVSFGQDDPIITSGKKEIPADEKSYWSKDQIIRPDTKIQRTPPEGSVAGLTFDEVVHEKDPRSLEPSYYADINRGFQRLEQGANALEAWASSGLGFEDHANKLRARNLELQDEMMETPVHSGVGLAAMAGSEAARQAELEGSSTIGQYYEGTKAFLENAWENPDTLGTVTHAAAELVPQIASFFLGTKGVEKLLPTVLTGTARSSAAVGGGGFLNSIVNTYGANVAEALEKGMNYDQAEARAALQSVAQGGVDALTSAIIPIKIGPNQFFNVPAQTALQMLGGATGEIARYKVVGESPDKGEVIAEGLLEALGMPADVLAAMSVSGQVEDKPKYFDEGKELEGDEMKVEALSEPQRKQLLEQDFVNLNDPNLTPEQKIKYADENLEKLKRITDSWTESDVTVEDAISWLYTSETQHSVGVHDDVRSRMHARKARLKFLDDFSIPYSRPEIISEFENITRSLVDRGVMTEQQYEGEWAALKSPGPFGYVQNYLDGKINFDALWRGMKRTNSYFADGGILSELRERMGMSAAAQDLSAKDVWVPLDGPTPDAEGKAGVIIPSDWVDETQIFKTEEELDTLLNSWWNNLDDVTQAAYNGLTLKGLVSMAVKDTYGKDFWIAEGALGDTYQYDGEFLNGYSGMSTEVAGEARFYNSVNKEVGYGGFPERVTDKLENRLKGKDKVWLYGLDFNSFPAGMKDANKRKILQYIMETAKLIQKTFSKDMEVIIVANKFSSQVYHSSSPNDFASVLLREYKNGRQVATIAVNEKMLLSSYASRGMGKVIETLAHEFGHALFGLHFNNAPPIIQNRILADYRRWAQQFESKLDSKWKTLVEGKYPIFKFLYHRKVSMAHHTDGEFAELNLLNFQASDMSYEASFDEYVADQVARRFLRDMKDDVFQDTMQDSWWRHVVGKLKQFFNAFEKHFHVEKGIDVWLEYLQIENLLESHMDTNLAFHLMGEDPVAVNRSLNRLNQVADKGEASSRPIQSDRERLAYKQAELFYEDMKENFLRIVPEDASVEEVREAMDEFSPRMQHLLKALDRDDWLGFDYPSQALNEVFQRDFPGDFDVSPQVLIALSRLINSVYDGARPFGSAPTQPRSSGPQYLNPNTGSSLITWNKFMKHAATLLQIGYENPNVPGVSNYIQAVRDWWAKKIEWTSMADAWLKKAQIMSEKESHQFARFAHAITIASDEKNTALTAEEILAIREKYPVSDRAWELWEESQGNFQAALNAVYDLLEKDLSRKFRNIDDPIERQNLIERHKRILQEERAKMLSKKYWPLSRFGNNIVRVFAPQDMNVDGRFYGRGDLVLSERYETKKEAFRRLKALESRFGQGSVKMTVAAEETFSFEGMPPALVERMRGIIRESLGENPSPEEEAKVKKQLQDFDEMLLALSPGHSFTQRLQRRKGTPGYNLDALRGYADYFMRFANFISRLEYHGEMSDALEKLRRYHSYLSGPTQGTPTVDASKFQQLHDHLQRHFGYIMNPGNEWAFLRAAGFHWYLGYLPKSAFVNMTQVVTHAYPYLAARFSDTSAVAELTKAYRNFRTFWKGDLTKMQLEDDLQEALNWGIKAGFLNESLATELAGVAEGNNLKRLMPSRFIRTARAAKITREITAASTYLFQRAEQVNRFVTFTATWRLLRKQKLGNRSIDNLDVGERARIMQEMFAEARDAVDRSMFEYAIWNRPQLAQGKKSMLFLFKMHLQNSLYFVTRDPGRVRYILMLGMIAGASGLPFADDLSELWKYGYRVMAKQFGWDPRYENLQLEARRYLNEVTDPYWASIALNGLSSDMFGLGAIEAMTGNPMPRWDISGSTSMGNIIPGFKPLVGMVGNAVTGAPVQDPMTQMGRMTEEVAGPVPAIPLSVLEAVMDPNPYTWRNAEKMLPNAMKWLSKSARQSIEGYETDASGKPIMEVDVRDPETLIEQIGQAAGFASYDQKMEKEWRWEAKQITAYWAARRSALYKQYWNALAQGDPEGIADMNKALRDFNKEVPFPTLRVSRKDIQQSIKRRAKGEVKSMLGMPDTKKDIEVFRDVQSVYAREPMK